MEETIEKQTNILTKYADYFYDKLPDVVMAIIILIIGYLVAKSIKKLLNRTLAKYKTSIGMVGFMINFTQSFIILIAVLQALSSLGVNTASFTAILGAAGFSIGFAFKEVISNLGSSMIILFFKPFVIGDYIRCGEFEGTVQEIQMFFTIIKTVDNKHIIIPNFNITSNPVINHTSQHIRRIDFVFNVSSTANVNLLYSIANDIFKNEDKVLKDPEPLIAIDSMNHNMIKFIAKPWVITEDYWDMYYLLMEKFKRRFDEEGIEMAKVNVITPV